MPVQYNPATGRYEIVGGTEPAPTGAPAPLSMLGVTLPEPAPEDAMDILDKIRTTLGLIIEGGLGLAPGPGALRTGLALLGGGAASGIRGESMLEGAVTSGGIQGAGELLRQGPRIFNKIAAKVGGARDDVAAPGLEALQRENERLGVFDFPVGARGLPVGAHQRTASMVRDAGEEVARTRAADPHLHNIRATFQGSTDELFDRSINTRLPISEGRAIKGAERAFLRQHRGRRGPAPLTTEELANLEVGLKHSPEAENVIKAKKRGELITGQEQRGGQIDADLARRARQRRYEAESAPFSPDEVKGPMRLADEHFADLKAIETLNEAIRFPDIIAEPGKAAARGGLGAGIGGTLGALNAGVPGALLGGALGPFVFAPRSISMMGLGLNRAGTIGPTALRAGEAIAEILPDPPVDPQIEERRRRRRAGLRRPGR